MFFLTSPGLAEQFIADGNAFEAVNGNGDSPLNEIGTEMVQQNVEQGYMNPSVTVNNDTSDLASAFSEYAKGLLSTVGQENQINREYNSAEAQLNREFNSLEAEKNRSFNSAEASAARVFSAQEAELNRLFNAAEAEKNREWQTTMSNTAYQRAMEDMKKAGLNPVLMAAGGFSANTPSGSVASGSSAGSFAASGQAASGQNASYNVGGGDTVSDLISSIANAAKGLGSILSGIADFLPTTVIKK